MRYAEEHVSIIEGDKNAEKGGVELPEYSGQKVRLIYFPVSEDTDDQERLDFLAATYLQIVGDASSPVFLTIYKSFFSGSACPKN